MNINDLTEYEIDALLSGVDESDVNREPTIMELLPRDDTAILNAWNEIMSIAVSHALIVAAVDGVVTLALPSAQVENGWYERCQYNHLRGEHPKMIERERNTTDTKT